MALTLLTGPTPGNGQTRPVDNMVQLVKVTKTVSFGPPCSTTANIITI